MKTKAPPFELPPEELEAYKEIGRQAAVGHEMPVPRMEQADLRKFVLSYCDRHIYTDRDIPKDMLGTVFMPVLFGALHPKDAAQAALDAVLGEETAPEPYPDGPVRPIEPTMPTAPVQPEWFKDDAERERLQHEIRWLRETPETLEAFDAKVESVNAEGKRKYTLALQAWEAECELLKLDYAKALAQHKREQAKWRRGKGKHHRLQEEWSRTKARKDAIGLGFLEAYTQNLGVIYGDVNSDSTSGWSVNGLPTFFSCRLMHKEDWSRVVDAIKREMDRRETMEV